MDGRKKSQEKPDWFQEIGKQSEEPQKMKFSEGDQNYQLSQLSED